MSYDKHTVGGLLSTDDVLIAGDTCHATWGGIHDAVEISMTDKYTLDSACTPSATLIGSLNSADEIYVRDGPLDDKDLRDCVVPQARQPDWDSMTFCGQAMSLDASYCDCYTGGSTSWSYDFTSYSAGNGDTYWYANPWANQFGTGNWTLDPNSSYIVHHSGATPYWEIQVWCMYNSIGLVWSGEKQCGHDPDGSYARTGGCDNQDPLVWNKL